MHFSPNLCTSRIGTVRDFPGEQGPIEVVVWISLAQPIAQSRNVRVRYLPAQPTIPAFAEAPE